MGKLADLLRNKTVSETISNKKKQTVIKEELKTTTNSFLSSKNNTNGDMFKFDLTDEEIALIRSKVVEIDMNGKSRKDIIIGMYGLIKNPKDGKRFVIPTLSFEDEEYIYNYANYMKLLVNKPEDFEKIMNWE